MNRNSSSIPKRFLDLPVSRKVMVIAFLSSLFTLALLCSVSFIRESRSFSDRKANELEMLSRILESNTVASLKYGDRETAKEYLDSMAQDPDIRFAALYDNRGELFAQYSREKEIEPPSSAPSFIGRNATSNTIQHARPVMLGDEFVGTVFMDLDTSSLKAEINRSLIIAIILFIGGLALTTILASRMQLLITSPINELLAVTRAVSEKKDYRLSAKKHGDDEIGSLVDSFNRMLEAISSRNAELKNINSSLEETVEKRTNDLKKRNEELRDAMEAAKASSVAKSEFLATISHELRTPMNAIVGTASMLKDSDIDDESKDFVDTISLSSDTLLALINDVLDYSKIESGRLDLENEPFELLPILENSVEIASARKMSEGPICVLDCDPKLPSKITGDATRLKQILINLVNNAVKFTDTGYVLVKVSHSAKGDQSGSLRIEVVDTGIGIPSSKIGQLFQHFSQLDSSTTRKYGGTGLGLAISIRLARAMGGDIMVESEVGKGSAFTLSLPLRKKEEDKPIAGNRIAKKDAIDQVELIDVLEPLNQSIRDTLEHWGFSIQTESLHSSTIRIVSLIAEDPEETSERANEIENKSSTIAICRKPHLAAIRNSGFANIITLPLRISQLRSALENLYFEPTAAKTETVEKRSITSVQSDLRILLAEDHRINQNVFKKILQRAGYEIDIAENGEEAIRSFETHRHHLIFMDLHMPVLDGLEATRKIREDFPVEDQPWIIAFTANAQLELARKLLAQGMNDFLAKPVRKEDILNAIKRYREAKGDKS